MILDIQVLMGLFQALYELCNALLIIVFIVPVLLKMMLSLCQILGLMLQSVESLNGSWDFIYLE